MKIRITLGFDGELDGYDPKQVIALTLAEAKFNKIQARGGTLSNRFGLAKTANNKRVLGLLDELSNVDSRPYQRHDCKIEVDNIQIFTGFALIEESSDSYYLRVYGSTGNFFDTIKGKKLADLDLSTYNHQYLPLYVNQNRQNTTGLVYPNVNYGKWNIPNQSSVPFTDFFPAFFIKDLLEISGNDFGGYTVSGYDEDTRAIPFSKKQFLTDVNVPSKMTNNAGFAVFPLVASPGTVVPYNVVDFDPTSRINAGKTQMDLTAGKYILKGQAIIDNQTASPIGAMLYNASNGSAIVEWEIDANDTLYEAYEFEYDSGIEECKLELRVFGGGGQAIVLSNTYIEIVSGVETVMENRFVNTSMTMPDVEIKDLFLNEAARMNALILVDDLNKTINFVKFDDIAAKYPIADDWSEKINLAEGDPKVEYRISDYAQSNYFKFKDGSDVDPVFESDNNIGEGYLSIDDDGLKLDSTIYQSKFAYTSLISSAFQLFEPMAFIPRYTESSLDYFSPDTDPKPRIVYLEQNTDFIIDITGELAKTPQSNVLETPTWQDEIDTNYTALQSALTKTKTIEVLMRLSISDIQNLDFTKPKFLLNQYWYLMEVKQFKVNRPDSTICKFLRL